MIKTTDAYKAAIKKNRILHHKVDISFPDGTTATAEDIDLRSFQIKDNTSNRNSFDIGGTFAKQLTIKLDNLEGKFTDKNFDNAKIVAKIGLEINETIEWLNKGVYYSETGIDTGNVITINAYDKMINFDQPYSLSKLIYPATLLSIVQDACTCCGTSLAPDSASFPNNGYIVDERPEDSNINFRKVLQWVGQISCTFMRINDFEKLSLQWYNTELLESDDDIENSKDVVKISELGTGSSISTNDVVITGIMVEENGKGEDTTYQCGTDGYVLKISDNGLIQNGNGGTVSEFIGKKLNGLSFRPMTIKSQSDPSIEPGDIGLVTDLKGRKHRTIFTEITYTAYAQQEFICGAETPTRLSAKRYSEITKVYKGLRKNLLSQKTEFTKALENLTQQIQGSKGLFPINIEQEDGSRILYFCDTPKLKDAKVVIKLSSAGWAMSSDGGNTWNIGALVDGEMIAKLLAVKGISAGWINTGALRVLDADGKETLYIDADTGEVRVTPTLFSLSGKSVGDIASATVEDFVNKVYRKDLEKLQDQIDGKVEEYYYAYKPTLDNLPASEWKTEEDKKSHEGDKFFDKSTGHAYRFFKNDETGEYEWTLIQDSDIIEALNKASKAQETADGKRRTFLATPEPPYDPGDLWIQGTAGDIMVCKTGRQTGTYQSNDWVKSSKYTDDSKAQEALDAIDKLKTLNIVLSNEYQTVSTDASGNYKTFPEVATTVSVYMGSVDMTDKATYTIEKSAGITGSWNLSTKTYTIKGLSGDSGYVDITATYSKLKGTRRFTVAKLKAGADGENGEDGEDGGTWTIEVSSNTIKRGEDGNLVPFSITAKAWYQVGKTVSRKAYSGRLYVYTSTNGSTWTQASRLDASSSITYDVSKLANTIYWLKFTLCATGTDTVIDQQTIQILDDISSLTGAIMLEKLSGGWQGVYQGDDGKYYIDAEYIRGKTMSAKYLDAKNLTVTNKSGINTLKIDADGNISMYVTSLSIAGAAAASKEYVNNATAEQLQKAKVYANSKTGNLLNGTDLTTDDRKTYWNISGSITEGQADPDGGKNAILITGTVADNFVSAKYANNNPVRTSGQYEIRVWLKSSSTLKTAISFNRGLREFSVTTSWKQYKFSIPVTAPSTANAENFTIGGFGKLAKGSKLYIYKPEITYSYTPQDILNMLTNNGSMDAIVMNNNQLYIKGEYIVVKDLSSLKATLGGWKINANSISSANDTMSLLKEGKIKIGNALIYSNGNAAVIKSGLSIYTDRAEFTDGTGEFRLYGMISNSGKLLSMSHNIVGVQASSSKRYKEHIKNVEQLEAERLLSLPVVWFKYKDGYLLEGDPLCGKAVPGFYAEDVSKLFPECATYDEENRPEDWNYRMLIPAMLKLIQGLYKEVRKNE